MTRDLADARQPRGIEDLTVAAIKKQLGLS
jgi:hypothetical protein